MERNFICNYCTEPILGGQKGVIMYGDAYHEGCYNASKVDGRLDDLEELYDSFKDIDNEVLEDLYMFLVDEGATKKEDLFKMLRSKWTIITRGIEDNGYAGIDIDTFSTKIALRRWLSDEIHAGLANDYTFSVEYILNNGKIVCEYNNFSINVSF